MMHDRTFLEKISLTHGQALFVLKGFALSNSTKEGTFDAFIKALRRDGVPFDDDEMGAGAGFNISYRYVHLMELALALAFKTQGILARDMVKLIVKHRLDLRKFFYRAYLERDKDNAQLTRFYFAPLASTEFSDRGVKENTTSEDAEFPKPNMHRLTYLTSSTGWFLDMALADASNNALLSYQFKLISAPEAAQRFLMKNQNLYPRPPIPLTDIAEDIIRLIGGVPEIRRGQKARS